MILLPLSADLASRLLGLVRSLINPHYLGPEQYGLLGLLSAWLLYATLLDFGLLKRFEVLLPHAKTDAAFSRLVFSYLKRLVLRVVPLGLLLAFLVSLQFGAWVATVSFGYIFFSNLDCFFSIVARTRQKTHSMALFLLGMAVLQTLSTWMIAPRFGFSGLVVMQSILSAVGVGILWLLFCPRVKWNQTTIHSPAVELVQSHSEHWLFLGQATVLIWMSMDRIILGHQISSQDLGFWNLGTMAVAFVWGFMNTAGMWQLPQWTTGKRGWLRPIEFLSYLGMIGLGLLGFTLVVEYLLPQYKPGLLWNQIWIISNISLGLLIHYDAFRRATRSEPAANRDWLIRKICGTLLAFAVFMILRSLSLDPRLALCLSVQVLCLSVAIAETVFTKR